MVQLSYKTKKALKESVGKKLRFQETSMFGFEYPADGTGKVTGVGPDAYNKRDWYATVTLKDDVIVSVK